MLVKASARKFLWLVVLFVLSVALADLAINEAFSRMGVSARVPYLIGNTAFPLQAGPVAITIPVAQGFTLMFAAAVLVALLALAAYYYQDRGSKGKEAVASGETESRGP
jgi:hypothetical protein